MKEVVNNNSLGLATPHKQTLKKRLWMVPNIELIACKSTESTGTNLFEDQVGGGIAQS